MAVLAKKIHLLKSGGGEQTVNVYSTTTEVGSNYIKVNIDGTAGYAALGATSDTLATVGRVTKSGSTYALKSSAEIPYTKKTYTTAGTYTFTVPSGITKLKVTVAGAGGGGGGALEWSGISAGNSNTRTDWYEGGNGGSGALTTSNLTVTSRTTYSITVGAGGSGGVSAEHYDYSSETSVTAGSGGTGGTSKFDSITAQGGLGGTGARYYEYRGGYKNSTKYEKAENGSSGTSYGSGAAGGAGGTSNHKNGYAGSSGYVYVEYGAGI